MFLIRRAKIEDVGTLLKLAKMVHFINLPADRDIISEKVARSRESFLKAAEHPVVADDVAAPPAVEVAPSPRPPGLGDGLASLIRSSDLFMFVLEEIADAAEPETGSVLGTSQIISRMGGPGQPNVSFKLSRKDMFSQSLQVGVTHTLAKLVLDESGPTEIGGLILQPSYRGHKLRLGRFLSLIRFHYMGLNRALFSPRVIAELMGPMMADGQNTLWEYLGRRFINLTYAEADRFCQYSKEFMFTLLPREEIYLTLLPPEARAVIAQVGPETAPARRMLEKLNFRYEDHIDPFDGGPHLQAVTDEITLVKDTRRGTLGADIAIDKCTKNGFVSVLDEDAEFRAVETPFDVDRQGKIRLPAAVRELLGAEPGMNAGYTPLSSSKAGPSAPSSKPKQSKSGRRAARTAD